MESGARGGREGRRGVGITSSLLARAALIAAAVISAEGTSATRFGSLSFDRYGFLGPQAWAQDGAPQGGVPQGGVPQGVDLSEPLALETLVRLAKERNPGLARARESGSQARGAYKSSLSAVLPSVSASVGYDQTKSRFSEQRIDPQTGRFLGRDEVNDFWGLSVSAQSNLLDPSSWYSVAASRRRVGAANLGVRDSEQELVFTVETQYYALVRAQDLAAVRASSLQLAREQLERARALYELGSVARTDVLQAQVNLASAERDQIAAANSIEQERANLAVLLSIPAGAGLLVEAPGALPDTSSVFDESALVAEALAARPDHRRAAADLSASRLAERSARWSRWPSVSTGFRYSKDGDAASELFDALDDEYSWGLGVNLNVPIFDGLRTKGSIQQATASRKQDERTLEESELQVALDVRLALIDVRDAVQAIRAAREGVGFAEESVRLQQALYESGGGTLLEWNNAQVELTRARNALVDAEINLRLAHAALEKARGRAE